MASAALVEGVSRPVRVIVREFIENVINGEDEIKTEEIIEYALKRFADDTEFKTAAARDVLYVVVPDVLHSVLTSRRATFIETPTGAKRRETVEKTARERLSKVFEATENGYKNFLVLRKRDLVELNSRDSEIISTRQRWVDFRDELAGKMNDVQTVGDSFKSAELESSWNRHFGPVSVPPTSA